MTTLEEFMSRFLTVSIVGQRVVAKRLIRQSPCAEEEDGSPSPDVPKGTVGTIEDVDADDEDDVQIWVNFDEPYETVLCSPDELEYAS